MHSLNAIERKNDEAMAVAARDERRPVLSRAQMWLGTSDRDFVLACELLSGLAEYCAQIGADKKQQCGPNMLWWYQNQINPIRKALGLTEFDFILDSVLALKARCDELEALHADHSD